MIAIRRPHVIMSIDIITAPIRGRAFARTFLGESRAAPGGNMCDAHIIMSIDIMPAPIRGRVFARTFLGESCAAPKGGL